MCKCSRAGCLAATQVTEKGTHVYSSAFFAGWLRGLGWKRLLLRSGAAASLEGIEVIEQASPEGDHATNGLAEVSADSSAEESGRKTQETAGVERTTGNMVGSTVSELLDEIQNSIRWQDAGSATHWKSSETSSCRVWTESCIFTGRSTSQKKEWQAMRRGWWNAFSLVTMSALAHHCLSQSVDC